MKDDDKSIMQHIDKGRCPNCNGIVRVIESEMTEILLNSDGSPRSSCNLSYNCIGFCGNCQRPVYIDPTGNGYRVIPATSTAVYLHNKIKEIYLYRAKRTEARESFKNRRYGSKHN